MLSNLLPRNKGTYLDKCRTIPITTNLFKVDFKEDTKIYIYSAKTQPEISHENFKKFRSMLMQSRKTIQRLIGTYAISGRTVFGCKAQQSGKGGAELNFKVEFQGAAYHIFLKMVKEVVLSDIYSPDSKKSGVVYSFLNNMLHNFFHQINYSEIGRSRKYFDSQHYTHMESARVLIYKGYSSSFTLLEKGLFLRIDPAVKIVRSETVLDVINRIYSLSNGLSKQEKRLAVERELIGKMVMANYGKNQYHVIDSIVFDVLIDGYTFFNGREDINLLQYYKDAYGIEIGSKRQPLVKAEIDKKDKEKGKEIILIPQLLLMSGLPDDFDQRKRRQISDHTIVPPSQKLSQIAAIFEQFNSEDNAFNPRQVSQKLGIKLDTKPAQINAKQLPIPELQLGKRDRVQQHKSTNFTLFSKALFDCSIPLNIAVVCPTDYDLSQAKNLFQSTCQNLGLQHKLSSFPIKFQDTKMTLKNIEHVIMKEIDSNNKSAPNMFWFILPNNFKAQYSNIKKIVLRTGIEKCSQACLISTLQKKGVASVLTKILLQMAAKVGNKLWVPRIPAKLSNSGVMVLGIQNYGDQMNKNNSILSFCCNSNKEFSQFYSNYLVHPKNETAKTHMPEIIINCVSEFMRSNKNPPSDLILIKNGSTKYDNKLLVQTEVSEIKETLKALHSHPAKLTYILLDKDTNQKFFAAQGQGIANPQSGMLVDCEAVGKGFEFYLVAQQCNRGTVRPTFYKIIYSDSSLEQGLIEELMYSQCFNYMNWSGSIKVPSVLQYAKKLSMFAGQYLGDNCVGESLHRHLYYI